MHTPFACRLLHQPHRPIGSRVVVMHWKEPTDHEVALKAIKMFAGVQAAHTAPKQGSQQNPLQHHELPSAGKSSHPTEGSAALPFWERSSG